MSASLKPAANWLRQADRIAASAETLGRFTGLTVADLLARFADPAPYYGQPPAEFRDGWRRGPEAKREAVTREELEAERRAEQRYQEVVGRIRRRYGLAGRKAEVAA
jgi:hypothetical protein